MFSKVLNLFFGTFYNLFCPISAFRVIYQMGLNEAFFERSHLNNSHWDNILTYVMKLSPPFSSTFSFTFFILRPFFEENVYTLHKILKESIKS